MYQNCLIMMLCNLKTQTWHPIFYREKPFPGGESNNQDIIRFQSQGHHTTGFKTREEAIKEVDEMKEKLKPHFPFGLIVAEIEEDLPWDGHQIPTDHQIRDRAHFESRVAAVTKYDPA